MSRKLTCTSLALVAALFLGVAAFGQTVVTTKKTTAVQNPDGSWTVIEYPVNKEVMVNLTPGATMPGATGMAHVMRSADGTKVMVDLNNVTGDTSTIYAYAIDPAGMPMLLGPLTVANGTAKGEFSTPMNEFMLVLSPEPAMKTFDSSSAFLFRSELPTGFAVVPRRKTSSDTAVAAAEPAGTAYDVPLLNVPSFKDDTEVRVKFDGALKGLDAKAYIDPDPGKTTIKMRFSDMQKVPGNKRFVLWAKAPDGSYTKLGQVVNTGSRDEGEIRGETALKDFGLFVTVEDADVNSPTSRTYSVFTVPVSN